MSIRREWQKLVADGTLVRLAPALGDPASRTVLMCKEVNELLTQEMEEGPAADRRSRLLATIENFVAGRRLVVCMDPFAARNANIGRLAPIEDSIWDIRCREKPAIRVFCRFVEKDVLLAVTCRPRSVRIDWLGWFPLGDRNSTDWERGKTATRSHWKRYFPTYEPVSGDNLDDYLSNATLE